MLRPVIGATALVVSMVAGSASAAPSITILPGQGDSINEDTQPYFLAATHRPARVMVDLDPSSYTTVPPHAVNSNKVYLNNCKPNGCVVLGGGTISSIDGANYQGRWIRENGTLSAFSQSDAVWQEVVDCVRDVFSPFGVEIVTDNPSPAQHFEIMVAGRATQIGGDGDWLGVSGSACFENEGYIPNSLVFVFANTPGYEGAVEDLCATAAQEIAHSFSLDHVIEPSDPMTYFGYAGRKRFRNMAYQCGSDCVGGVSPDNDTCTGSGTNKQIHPCICTGQSTQNSFTRITSLFGAGTPTPPTVTFLNPTSNANVEAGFGFSVEAMDNQGVQKVQAYVDDVSVGLLNSPPWAFNAPATLEGGKHTIRAIATDLFGVTGEATRSVYVGAKCENEDDCPNDTDACIGGRCVAGPTVDGGLGATCDVTADCESELCATDREGEKHCVEPCNKGDCPSDFGCLPAPNDDFEGVCWPGYDEGGGGGGCQTSGNGGALPAVLALGALVRARRRRAVNHVDSAR